MPNKTAAVASEAKKVATVSPESSCALPAVLSKIPVISVGAEVAEALVVVVMLGEICHLL